MESRVGMAMEGTQCSHLRIRIRREDNRKEGRQEAIKEVRWSYHSLVSSRAQVS
jgi:hypothetical protein